MFEWLFGKPFEPAKDIPSLSGKVILVTGGTSISHLIRWFQANNVEGNVGLGKETIVQLAKHEPKEIFLAARTPSKAEAAIKDIKKAVPNGNVSYLKLDLSSLASVKQAADEFKSRSDRLDILINNAGIMAVPFSMTEDRYEIQFGTCHMGHALLTKLLLPTLLKTAEEPGADVRVVNLSSEGHNMAPVGNLIYNQAELEQWGTWRRYGQAKLANIYHARELQRRYPSITATSVHPGIIITDLYNASGESSIIMRTAFGAMRRVLKDVHYGAKNQLWAATASKEEVRRSYYFTPIGSSNGGSFWMARKPQLAEQLWEWTEKEFERHGY